MAEEVHNASINLPRAIVWSVPIGCLMGIAFILPITFTLPDIGTLLEGASRIFHERAYALTEIRCSTVGPAYRRHVHNDHGLARRWFWHGASSDCIIFWVLTDALPVVHK